MLPVFLIATLRNEMFLVKGHAEITIDIYFFKSHLFHTKPRYAACSFKQKICRLNNA